MARVDCGHCALADQRADMVLVLETGNVHVRLRLERRARDAPGRMRLEQRQAAAANEIVDQRGDEDRLARARQPRDAETQRRGNEARGEVGEIVECQHGIVGKACQFGQCGKPRAPRYCGCTDMGVALRLVKTGVPFSLKAPWE